MRDAYIDILKGLGITFVVMGHAEILAIEFNWFHLALFFFVSGFLFKAEQCLDYGKFFLHKIKTLWKPFVLYNSVFFVLQDFLICIKWIVVPPAPEGIVSVANWISIYELPRHISEVIFTGAYNIACGALWFMALFFSNILIFGILVNVTYNKPKWQLPVLIILCFAVGATIVKHSPGATMYADLAMAMIPVTAAGFYLKKFCTERNVHASDLIFTWKGGILLIIAIGIFAFIENIHPEIFLFQYHIMTNWFIVMIAAFSGIYLTMFVARLILFSDLLKKVVAYIGSKSFHIMALQYIGFKILTSLYVIFLGLDYNLMNEYMLPELPRFLYILFGVGVPLIFCKIYSIFERRFS